jgi:hypothetical protein
LAILAAFVAGGYLFFNRSGHFEQVSGGVIASPATTGPRGGGRAPFPIPKPTNGTMPPGFKVVEQKVVELNSATLAESETIPGITPDYAKKSSRAGRGSRSAISPAPASRRPSSTTSVRRRILRHPTWLAATARADGEAANSSGQP